METIVNLSGVRVIEKGVFVGKVKLNSLKLFSIFFLHSRVLFLPSLEQRSGNRISVGRAGDGDADGGLSAFFEVCPQPKTLHL